MSRRTVILPLLLLMSLISMAQVDQDAFTANDDISSNTFNPNRSSKDSTDKKKEAPRGMYVWTVNELGDMERQDRDTIQHLFMNTIFTEGKYGEYNTTGNLGSARINRIFTDRKDFSSFVFANPYSYFYTPVTDLRFTNTLAPITLLSYNNCGSSQAGEDHLKVLYAVNVNKQLGAGMKFDYLYGKGYYQYQNTSLFDWTYWTSYLGERYQAHFIFSTNHSKFTENGGITEDSYITHPESKDDQYTSNEIPVNLEDNWNVLDSYHFFLTHRYNVGFNRKVPMTEEEIKAKKFAMESKKENDELKRKEEAERKGEKIDEKASQQKFAGRPKDAIVMGDINADSIAQVEKDKLLALKAQQDSLAHLADTLQEDTSWLKNEYVPVTSFIHTLKYDHYHRTYLAYQSPTDYYLSRYNVIGAAPDSIDDQVKHYRLQNTFAISMLEGFNKWAKMGMKLYAKHDLQHYELPDTVSHSTAYTEGTLYGGVQLIKQQGRTFHYNATGELGVLGKNFGDIRIDGTGDLNVPLFGDTTRLYVNAFFHTVTPDFLYRHYHSTHFWWDDDLQKMIHSHLEGKLFVGKTNTTLRFAYDNIQNYAYFGMTNSRTSDGNITGYEVHASQSSHNISVITAEIQQDFRWKAINWENRITFQKSTEQSIIPVPDLNIWSNLYLNFRIAKVLRCHFGADLTYFTEYNAPEYSGQLSSYVVQENAEVSTKVGNYPFVNVYANFLLKGCRFFVQMSHVNAGQGSLNYFTTPHFPMNQRIFRIGLAWYFYN